MKLVQILNKDNVREALLEYWENTEDVMERKKEICDNILTDFGYEETFKYVTYYEQLTPIVKEREHFSSDEELVAREVAIMQRQKKVNREKAYVHRVLNYDARYSQFEEKLEDYIKDRREPINFTIEGIEEINNPQRIFLSDFHHTSGRENVIAECLKSVAGNACGDFELILTGDMIQGCLRDADIIDGNLDIVEQAVSFADVFLDSLLFINEGLGILRRIVIIPGNHDRINLTNYKGAKVPSMARIIAKLIAQGLNGVEVICDDEYIYEDCYRNKTIVTHGHLTGGIKNLRKYYGNSVKVIHAHFHHYYKDNNIMGLPPICESNEFEKSLGIPDDVGRKYVIIDEGWIKECQF